MKKYLVAFLLGTMSLSIYASDNDSKLATVEYLYSNGADNELLYKLGTDSFKEWYDLAESNGDIDYNLPTSSQDLDEGELSRTLSLDVTATGEVEAIYDIFGKTQSSYYKLECNEEVCLIDGIR